MARAWILRLAVLGAALLATFAIAEIALLLLAPPPPARGGRIVPDTDAAGLPELSGIPQLGAPNAHGQHRGVVWRTNAHGLRGPARSARARRGVLRIAVGGDSVTAGWGVREEHTYPAQLEAILHAEADGRRFEVLNLGLPGLDATHVIGRMAKLDPVYAPDLLVYGFTPNDIEGPRYERIATKEEQGRFARERLYQAPSGSRVLALLSSRIASIRDYLRPPRAWLVTEQIHNFGAGAGAWADFLGALDALAALADHRDRCAGVLIHTQLTHLGWLHPYAGVYDRVAAAAQARGLFVRQTLGDFRGRPERALWVGAIDAHPNREGHAILARALADEILALPARCLAPRR